MNVEEIVPFLAYSGISLTLFLILLLSRNWKQQPSKLILAGMLLNFLLVFLALVFLENGSGNLALLIVSLLMSVPYSWGPLLYFYIQSIYEPNLRFNKDFFRHFIPFFALTFLIVLPLLLNHSGLLLLPYSKELTGIAMVVAGTGMLFLAWYVYLSFRLLHQYRRLIKKHYSSLSHIDLRWVSVWVKGFFILLLLDMLLPVIALLIPGFEKLIFLEFFFFTAFIWYIGYFGINQRPVFLPAHLLASARETREEKRRTEKTGAVAENSLTEAVAPQKYVLIKDEAEVNELVSRLSQALEKGKMFKDQNLTLRQLAEAIDTTDKKLSELFSQRLHTSFYAYVNGYRVEAFKEMVRSGQAGRYTLLSLAFEAGFSSKASFNRIFKQSTGQTPGQFKKKYS